MRNRNTIIILLAIFTAICIYHLVWTGLQFNYSKKINQYESKVLNNPKDTAAQGEYGRLMSDEGFMGKYKQAIDNSFSLGLDLQGGMFATLEVGVGDVIRSLSNNSQDPSFLKAIKMADSLKQNSGDAYVNLFVQSLKKVNPNANLGAIFANPANKISVSTPEKDVVDMLNREATSAIDRTFEIVRTRIDQFGVVSPNLQKQPATGRILLELPGVKEPARVRKLLGSTAKLEFWKTHKVVDAFPVLEAVNNKMKEINGIVEPKKDTASAPADTTKTGKGDTLAQKADTGKTPVATSDTATQDTAGMTDTEKAAKFRRENPFFAKLIPPGQVTPSSPMVGYALPTDTAEVNRMLHLEEVKELIPDDMKFAWTYKPLEGSKVHGLIALQGEEGKAALGGDHIDDARMNFDEAGKAIVEMNMDIEGAQEWARITQEASADPNSKKSVAVVLDNLVYTYPTVQNKITGGKSQITGNFSIDEAKDLANVLKAGQLPVPARIMSEDIVGPSLGSSNISNGLIAFIASLLVTIIFMVLYYKKGGMYAALALLFNLLVLLGWSAGANIVMTLPGIAGIVLTIGMAVDSNVLVFERIREEIREGKTQKAAIKAGFQNAFSSIMDSQITTFLTALVLYIFGIGPIRGFAVTLIIGIITSLIATLLLTRLILEYYADKGTPIEFGEGWKGFLTTNIDMKNRKRIFYIVSGVLTAISIISFVGNGFKLGVDFQGGRQYVVEFDGHNVSESELNAMRTNLAFEGDNPVIKTMAAANRVQITTSYKINDNNATDEVTQKVEAGLEKTIPSVKRTTLSSNVVGPTVANDIKRSATWSVLFALLIIAAYIFFRFRKWQYSLGALASLAHDTIIVLGIFSILKNVPLPFNVEIDQAFIAAILTIIGYSINDTVVVFDRIRENMGENRVKSITDVFNESVNETLSRTLITSGTTIAAAFLLLVFGGPAISGFAFAMFFGIVFGTYSSIFVASAIAMDLLEKEKVEAVEQA